MIFKTTQSDLRKYNGMKISALVPLPEEEYDKSDVGEMFRIRLENGAMLNAFSDEIEFETGMYQRIVKEYE